jgi:ADP-ribose pyrophosphatase
LEKQAEVTPDPGWRILREQVLCETPHLRVTEEAVATPSRPGGISWTVSHRRPASVVAPRTPGGRYLLIRQERVAVRRTLWEFPAGQRDGAHTFEETARRELAEEAGFECPGELIPLGPFFSSPGFTDECCHLFLAPGVVPRPGGPAHEEAEAILDIRPFPPEELGRMIAAGEIVDANTLAAYARLQARGWL